MIRMTPRAHAGAMATCLAALSFPMLAMAANVASAMADMGNLDSAAMIAADSTATAAEFASEAAAATV